MTVLNDHGVAAMSARSKSVWHQCAWRPCRRRFRPYSATNIYCSFRHYALARRVIPTLRNCQECGRSFLSGGTARGGKRRAGHRQRFHSRGCASRWRQRHRTPHLDVPALGAKARTSFAFALDGEGWIHKRLFILEIGNTDRAWLTKLRQRVGGVGSIRSEVPREARYKIMWRWRVSGANAHALLQQCLPDLTVKRDRARSFVRRYAARGQAPGRRADVTRSRAATRRPTA